MGLSKTNRILILLAIDTAFFLLELIAGYSVHSLALVADSFHMLNDVLSLCVGLWAVKVANSETSSKMYTYGWQRAETLGALVNGVFLVALCLSIFLEAIQRLVEPQEVKNPKLVCFVGCAGLLSNILGLVLFHDHSHGAHGHTHGQSHDAEVVEDVDAAEQGYNREDHGVPPRTERGVAGEITEPTATYSRRRPFDTQTRSSRRFSTPSRGLEDIGGHPASMRQDIIIAANRSQYPDDDESSGSDSAREEIGVTNGLSPNEQSTLLSHRDRASNYTDEHTPIRDRTPKAAYDPHETHNHAQPKPKEQKHGHHDLNMRGVFLHVMGDALGNIGVILSALVIWLTNYSWRFYVDPGISLVITVIILMSAIPLCKAASRILLQAVPHGLSIDHIKEDIEQLPGVIGSHHLHVWQLSDTKTVASIHIQVDTEIKGEGSERYMHLAKQVRQCLHAYGIHSSTIQPEFPRDSDTEDSHVPLSYSRERSTDPSQPGTFPGGPPSIRDGDPQACLLECDEDCTGKHCCPTKPT